MEIYSKTTRFALACNASDKIIGKELFICLSTYSVLHCVKVLNTILSIGMAMVAMVMAFNEFSIVILRTD